MAKLLPRSVSIQGCRLCLPLVTTLSVMKHTITMALKRADHYSMCAIYMALSIVKITNIFVEPDLLTTSGVLMAKRGCVVNPGKNQPGETNFSSIRTRVN